MKLKSCTYLFLFIFATTLNVLEPRSSVILTDSEVSDVAYIFAHGLGGNLSQAYYYLPYVKRNGVTIPDQMDFWLINRPMVTFDFSEVVWLENNSHTSINQEKVSLGQNNDIESLRASYQEAQDKLPECKFIGFGVSRGAATWINFCAVHKPENIKALVLESPFDTPLAVVKNYIKFLPGADFITNTLGNKILKYKFPAWDVQGIVPYDVVDKIPKEIPIFIFHSEKDGLIPVESSKRLSQKLADSDHEVYLLVLKQGDHANVYFDKECDICTFAIHAFYKKYNLPCNEAYAQKGKLILASCKIIKK